MTSLNHDDGIEIISFQAGDSTPITDPGYISINSVSPGVEDNVRVLPTLREDQSPKEKRIKGAVMVVGTVLILMCMILVGVTLSMSDHIDEMGKVLLDFYVECKM